MDLELKTIYLNLLLAVENGDMTIVASSAKRLGLYIMEADDG